MTSKKWLCGWTALALSVPMIGVAALGQKMTAWKDAKQREVIVSADHKEVTLAADAKTTAPGSYGIILSDAHLTVGSVIRLNDGQVTREITEWAGLRSAGKLHGAWTGQVSASPEQLGLPFEEVKLGCGDRDLPAWVIHPRESSRKNVWAIHVHGLRSSRYSMLRSVPSAARLGMTSLLPSYYGDAENHSRGEVCHYGGLETVDVEESIAYAVEHGAESIYLFGWSMGATISLLLSESSTHRRLIAGLVLVSPGPNTEAVIAENARTAGLPGPLADLAPRILSSPLLRRLAGLTSPVDFENLDWTRGTNRLRIPALVIHSRGDTEVPFSLTEAFARANCNKVTLKEFPPVPHQCEWNASPERFEAEVASWVKAIETEQTELQPVQQLDVL